MSRPIKFRAWNRETKTMGSAFPLDVITADIAERPQAYYRDWKNLDPMQFTGLTDKNGREIYEGDIIQNVAIDGTKMSKFIIEWRQSLCAFVKKRTDDEVYYMIDHPLKYAEIIGNLHETPELLK